MNLYNFNRYRTYFNKQIEERIKEYSTNDDLTNMIMYAICGGKRLRPIITLDICKSICGNMEQVLLFSVALELIHTACLIIDDLPCMDNDNYRRGQLSFHKKYSVKMAQLVSGELIHIAFKMIYDTFKRKPYLVVLMENVSKNLGILGAAGGQFMDVNPIHLMDTKREFVAHFKNKDVVKDLFYKKTTTFFEIGFIGGFLAGGGSIEDLDNVKEAAYYFGLAFQIYDDFDDIEQDSKRPENHLPNPNYIGNFGKNDAFNEFNESIDRCKTIMVDLDIYSETMEELTSFLSNKVKTKFKNI